jgi:hypothetical protein
VRAKFVNEKFTEDSDPIKDLGIGLIHHYFIINKTSDNIYYFIEKGPNFVEKNKPTTYIYSVKKGNVYRKHPDLYAHQELRSNSYAFNKGNSNKMAIPNDLNAAKEFIINHYLKKLKKSLNEKFTEDSDPVHDMGIGFYHPKTFNSYKNANNYIIEHLHLILKEENIPKDIIYDKQWYIKPKYHDKINDYIRKYIKIKAVDILSFSFHSHLHEILKKKGYPTYEY